MLKLNLSSDPQWIDLGHGVRVRVAPMTTSLMMAARRDPAVEAAAEGGAGTEELALLMAKAVAKIAISEWEGVGDESGVAVAPSLEGIDALLDVWPLFEAFQVKYVSNGFLLESEKNASAPSPSGTTAGAPDTAPHAPDAAPTARKS